MSPHSFVYREADKKHVFDEASAILHSDRVDGDKKIYQLLSRDGGSHTGLDSGDWI